MGWGALERCDKKLVVFTHSLVPCRYVWAYPFSTLLAPCSGSGSLSVNVSMSDDAWSSTHIHVASGMGVETQEACSADVRPGNRALFVGAAQQLACVSLPAFASDASCPVMP